MDHCSFCIEMKLTFRDLSNVQKGFMCKKDGFEEIFHALINNSTIGFDNNEAKLFFQMSLSAFR